MIPPPANPRKRQTPRAKGHRDATACLAEAWAVMEEAENEQARHRARELATRALELIAVIDGMQNDSRRDVA